MERPALSANPCSSIFHRRKRYPLLPPPSAVITSVWVFGYKRRPSNWRGEPLRDYETIVRLIATTTTAKGLNVTCRLDRRRYPVGRKVSNKDIATVNLTPHVFHGEWNYVIRPRVSL